MIHRTRVLPLQMQQGGTVTQQTCAQRCHVALGGDYTAGVEDGNQCFCAKALSSAAEKRPMSECNTPCASDKSQNCGGVDRILVFKPTCTGAHPYYQGCRTAKAKAFPYCDTSKSFDERVAWLIGNLTLEEKVYMMTPQPSINGNTCDCHTGGNAERLDIPPYMWLVETNTNIASACIKPGQCSTVFPGPMGLGASFNRTSWHKKGEVLSYEMRAFNNAGWTRFSTGSDEYIGITGYGPNINNQRDPRFGRSSELPGEDPPVSVSRSTFPH